MKALTICQPYPRLILAGQKHVENRTWPTNYRGPLAIHAGKSRQWLNEDDIDSAAAAGDPLIFGAVVAVCTLADCVRVGDIEAGRLDARFPQLRNRAHCFGPWCWVLTDVQRLAVPVTWRGAQGLFEIPEAALDDGEDRPSPAPAGDSTNTGETAP